MNTLLFQNIKPNTHRRRDETVLSRRRRRCEHNSQLAHDDCRRIRSTIWNWPNRLYSCLTTWILINTDNFFNNDVNMSSLLKQTQKQTQTQSVWPVSKLSIESVGSGRELVANSCTHRRRRRDATKQFRRVGVGGVYWALHDDLHDPYSLRRLLKTRLLSEY